VGIGAGREWAVFEKRGGSSSLESDEEIEPQRAPRGEENKGTLSALIHGGDGREWCDGEFKDLSPLVRISLRSLFALVTLVAIGMGYVGWQVRVVEERKEMARWILRHEGQV
jgi:hypothetical protein